MTDSAVGFDAGDGSPADAGAVDLGGGVGGGVAVDAPEGARLDAGAREGGGVLATVLTNFGGGFAPVTRFDVDGHAVDAHDGHLQLFGDTYYLYGTSYDCGFVWQGGPGAPFCGFKVYSSPDLVHWTDRGFLFDARTPTWQSRCDGTTYGCYRPHVAYNASTRRYVLWINSYDVGVGFHVFQSQQPTGPFVETDLPRLGVNGDIPPGLNNGDHTVFVDDDGRGYLVYTDWRRGGDLVVEGLDPGYLTGTGMFTRIGISATEAPAMFRRQGRYYITMSDPNCGYCTTGTGYLTASAPLGPWTGRDGRPIKISLDSCGGQPAAVSVLPGAAGPLYLYQSDLWNNGARNEALAHYYWAPLGFTADGAIQPLRCQVSVPLELTVGQPGRPNPPRAGRDQSTGTDGFHLYCDVGPTVRRLQTFTAGRSGRLTRVGLTTLTGGPANADLQLDVVSLGPDGLPAGVLATASAPAARIGWSAREIGFDISGVEVTAGQRYGWVMRSPASAGCYGFAYNDEGVYPAGDAYYSSDGGTSWRLEPLRSLKFDTTVE